MSADGTRDWKSSAPPVRRRPPETDGAADQTDAAMIRFACPACRKTLKSPPGTAGTKAVCPKCGQKVRVPGSNKTTLGLPVLEEIPASADAPAIPASPDDADAAAYAPLPADDPTPDNAGGRVCGILSCVFGGVAALICPPLFGVVGLALGVLSIILCKNKTLGAVGVVVSVGGMLIGMMLGAAIGAVLGWMSG